MSATIEAERAEVTPIAPGVDVIRGTRLSAHAYVLRGDRRVAVVDTGAAERIPILLDGLAQLGLAPGDVSLVVNTHEHFDHVGGNQAFPASTMVAAHASAASKLAEGDRFVTMLDGQPRRACLGLMDGTEIDLGGLGLRLLHAPGHTSGSACLFETRRGLLFTGDTLFAGGVLSYIAESGSLGDYLATLGRLSSMRITRILPGHGRPSEDAGGDIERAAAAARALLRGEHVHIRRRGDSC